MVGPEPQQPSRRPASHLRPLRIGDLEIAGPAVQAALSGYSDRAMRRVARVHGAPYCLHEVVVDKLLLQPGKLQRQILSVETDDHPIGGQIMGAEPVVFGKAARLMADAGFDVVDLNFGCPVPKVLGRCRGGFLVGDPPTALEMIDRVLEAVAGDVPVSVKMRRGIDDSADAERSFFTILEGAFERGVAAVTVHPRTVEQRYVGPSDWEFLARVRCHLGDDPVLLGSGDLFTAADCLDMIARTGVDGVTVARGCIGNPWIFAQVADLLAGRVPRAPSLGEQRAALELHWFESLADHGDRKGPGRARNHAIKYAALHPDGEAVRDAFVAVRGEAAFRAVLERYYPAERSAERAGDAIDLAAAAHRLKSCGVAGGRVASPS